MNKTYYYNLSGLSWWLFHSSFDRTYEHVDAEAHNVGIRLIRKNI